MTEQPDPKITPLPTASRPDSLSVTDDLRAVSFNRARFEQIRNAHVLEAAREEARTSFGKILLITFCGLVLILALAGCFAALFLDEAHTKSFISMAQVIFSVMSPIIAFVMGYYFANGERAR